MLGKDGKHKAVVMCDGRKERREEQANNSKQMKLWTEL